VTRAVGGDSRTPAQAEGTSLETWAEPQLHALEVRVFEARAVLQAVSNGAVDADVREPDQAELNCGLGIDDESACCDGRMVSSIACVSALAGG
jgi:hypothetical protein